MKIEVKGFKGGEGIEYVLEPENSAERALLMTNVGNDGNLQSRGDDFILSFGVSV